jgi:Ion channel
MKPPTAKGVRRRFLVALRHGLHVTWPVVSAILATQLVLGLLIGLLEGWSVGDAVYFSFVTDVVPRQAVTRALAIGIGFCGLLLTGLVAAIVVYAMRTALTDGDRR